MPYPEGFDIVAHRPSPTPWTCEHGFKLTDRPMGQLHGLGRSSCCTAGATYVAADRLAYCKCCLRTLRIDGALEDTLPRHAE